MDAHVAKPIDIQTLTKTISEILQKKESKKSETER